MASAIVSTVVGKSVSVPISKGLIPASIVVFGVFSATTIAAQDQPSLRSRVDAIQSVAQIKQQIKDSLIHLDRCAVGSCFNYTTTSICEAVGMLDVRVNGQIVGEMSGASEGSLPISSSDLALMKQIFSQCKPTNYQYWNWETMFHVGYRPDCATDRSIRKSLGVAPPKRCK